MIINPFETEGQRKAKLIRLILAGLVTEIAREQGEPDPLPGNDLLCFVFGHEEEIDKDTGNIICTQCGRVLLEV